MRGTPTTVAAAAACIVLATAGPAAAAANTGTDPGGAPAPAPNSVTWSETSDGTETIVNHRADPAAPLFASAFLSAGTATTVATGIPDATVMLNVTAVAATGAGHTRVWPCNESRPNSSVNNYTAGQTIPNFTAVHTDAAGYACVYTAGPADLLVDQYGVANGVAATSPERVLDTRTAAAVPAGGVVKIATTPGGTLWGNLTVIAPETSGHTRVWPCSEPMPTTSVNNFAAGQTIPNFTAAAADAAGEVCIYTSARAHLVFDRSATIAAGAAGAAGTPTRLLDSRNADSRPAAGSITAITTGTPNSTVLGNLTVVSPAAAGHTRVWPCSEPMPATSVNNFTAGQTIPNFTAARTDDLGRFCIYTTSEADLLFDQTVTTTAFTVTNPVRKLDTRTWGDGAGGDDTHWSYLAQQQGAPVRWRPCVPSIPVYVNQGPGYNQVPSVVQAAIDKVKAATGLPLTYAGPTTVTPTTANIAGYTSYRDTPSIVVAFPRWDETDLLAPASSAAGGMLYAPDADGVGGHAYHGYIVVERNSTWSLGVEWMTRLIMHELGHVVGVGHTDDKRQVMYPVLTTEKLQWGRGDWHGLSAIGRAAGCE